MFKLQSAIEKFFLSALVIIVAIVISYFIYKSFYSIVSHSSIKSYLVQASFDNIYGNKTSIFVLLKNETNVGNNVIISEIITFSNGTSKTYKIPFSLQMASKSGSNFLYDFATTNFPSISNNSQPIKISNVFIISGNYIIESENSSITYSSYYYTKSSLENVPLYYLNMSVTPLGAGNLIPGDGYYYGGSKVAISEKPNIGYAFSGWFGFGNGNYTGLNKTVFIEMNSNITEYAKYVKLVRMYVNATYNGIPVYGNGVLNATTNGTIYIMPGIKYTLSVPRYIAVSDGTRYTFESLQDNCGIPIASNSNSTTFIPSYANYNCKFMANYIEQYFLLINLNTSEGTVTPFGGWYNIGTKVKVAVNSNYGYAFSKAIGNGNGSYTGTDNPFYVTMNSPITENIIFIPLVNVYVESSSQSVPYSFLSNYNNTFYNGTTNSNFMVPAGSTLTLESPVQLNWGEREFISISSSTCPLSGSSITLPTKGGASCTVYINPSTIQYLFIMNEFLNGGEESNNFTYGTVYLNGNPMTSNQVWINAGTNVTFYATNDKAGYAFQGFSGGNGVLNGVAYSGVSGVDSTPGVIVGINQEYTETASYPPYQVQKSYSNGYNATRALNAWGGLGNIYDTTEFDCSDAQYTLIHVIMNQPVIEVANYYQTRSITEGTVNVVVHYMYYNITDQVTQYNYNNWQNFGWQSVPISESLVSSGTKTITIYNVTPYSNYSSGLGTEAIYYSGYTSFSQYGYYDPGSWSWTNEYSYSVYNFTSQQLSYMPKEYYYVVNQTISDIENQYPDIATRHNNTIVYVLNLQLSFSISGTQIYIDYDDIPTSTIGYGNFYNYQYSSGTYYSESYSYTTVHNYFGYSNYPYGNDGFLRYPPNA